MWVMLRQIGDKNSTTRRKLAQATCKENDRSCSLSDRRMVRQRLRQLFLLLLLATLCGGCIYRMPTDDDVRCVPLTNNPSITGDTGQNLLPGSGL
jgi:hypothetical protein